MAMCALVTEQRTNLPHLGIRIWDLKSEILNPGEHPTQNRRNAEHNGGTIPNLIFFCDSAFLRWVLKTESRMVGREFNRRQGS